MLDALKGVKDPEIHRDLVDLGMVKDIKIADNTIALGANLVWHRKLCLTSRGCLC